MWGWPGRGAQPWGRSCSAALTVASPCARFWARVHGTARSVGVCKPQTSLSKAYAKLCGGAGCSSWRSGGGEMPACAARPTERPMVYMCVRNRKGRSGRCSPCKVQAEMRCRGGSTTRPERRRSDGVGDEVGAGALRAPGWHGSTQDCPAGRIRGSRVTGGEEKRWRGCLPAAQGGGTAELRCCESLGFVRRQRDGMAA